MIVVIIISSSISSGSSSSNIIIVVVAVVVSGANVLQTASCTFLESDPFLGPEVPEGYFNSG